MKRRIVGSGFSIYRRAFGQAFGLWLATSLFSPASATTVGTVINNSVTSGYSTAPVLINFIAYIAGAIVAVIGLIKIRSVFDPAFQQQNNLGTGLWHMAAAGLLISVPAAWGHVSRTLGLDTPTGSTERAAAITGSVGGPLSLDQMMINFIADVKAPMGFLLWTLGALLGLFFIVTAFLRMASNAGQDGPKGSMGAGTMGRVVIGAILLSFAATADVFTTTLFGSDVVEFSYMSIPGVDAATLARANDALSAVLVFIQIIGFIAFMRGFLMLRAQADGNTSVSTAAAFTHIIGGAVAVNVSPALKVFQTTFCADASCTVFFFT